MAPSLPSIIIDELHSYKGPSSHNGINKEHLVPSKVVQPDGQ